MIGKGYTLTAEKIKEIYEAIHLLESFAELRISGTYSYRLGRLKDHLESVYKAINRTDKSLKKRYKGKDGKINVIAYREEMEEILEQEYEGVQIPEFSMSGFCLKDEASGEYKLVVPQKLINALNFHIKDDITGDKDKYSPPVPKLTKTEVEEHNSKDIVDI